MTTRFWRSFIIVAVIHIVLLSVYMFVSGCHRIVKRKPVVMMPVELMVAAPQKTVAAPPVVKPEPKPEVIPDPIKKQEIKPKPKPKQKLTKVKVSTKRVTRNDKKPPKKVLTSKEIKQRLESNIKVTNTKYNPNADALDFAKVKSALYNAWNQPSREEAGGVTLRAEITLAVDGRITGRRLVKPSGNVVLDQTVMNALNAVGRINGLSANFIKNHRKIVISFMVD